MFPYQYYNKMMLLNTGLSLSYSHAVWYVYHFIVWHLKDSLWSSYLPNFWHASSIGANVSVLQSLNSLRRLTFLLGTEYLFNVWLEYFMLCFSPDTGPLYAKLLEFTSLQYKKKQINCINNFQYLSHYATFSTSDSFIPFLFLLSLCNKLLSLNAELCIVLCSIQKEFCPLDIQ